MELNRKGFVTRIFQPLVGVVVGVYKALDGIFKAIGNHRITVVLTGYINPSLLYEFYRLVCPPVTVFQFNGFPPMARAKSW